jgi:hypothetical protein
MSDDHDAEPKQRTPKGLEIPVPTREEWERNMGKIAAPTEPAKPDDDEQKQN